MKKMKAAICGVIMAGGTLLGSCGVYAAQEQGNSMFTAEETVEYVMDSLKGLRLEQFNKYTDNYVDTYRNWIGIPIESEYRVFNELLQPGMKIGKGKKRYEFNRKLSERMMENLAWEVEEIEEDGNRAEIAMEITNLDMSDVMGQYEIYILENMADSTGVGIGQMIKDLSRIMDGENGLLSVIESSDKENTSTMHVTVTAFQDNGVWKIHLDDAFINAFMGNIYAEEYSDEIEKKIEELYRKQEEKMAEWGEVLAGETESWAEDFADRIERWADGF